MQMTKLNKKKLRLSLRIFTFFRVILSFRVFTLFRIYQQWNSVYAVIYHSKSVVAMSLKIGGREEKRRHEHSIYINLFPVIIIACIPLSRTS